MFLHLLLNFSFRHKYVPQNYLVLAGSAIPREKLTERALAGEEQSDRALVGKELKRGGELKTETCPSGVRGQGGRFTESSSQRDT